MKFNIAAFPGDGVGPEVVEEGANLLNRIGELTNNSFELKYGLVGGTAIDQVGTPLPNKSLDIAKASDAILFGAVGGPKWDDPRAPHRAEDAILGLRKAMGFFANIRPVRIFQPLINSSPIKPSIINGVDIVMIRELTGKLTSVDKANVLESSRLWREIATEMSSQYPDVTLEHALVDSCAMALIRNPSNYDVIVTENMFGDILTDEAAILSGSLGMLPSASLAGVPNSDNSRRRTLGLYEPIHGTAPDIAGQGKANPVATILSVALMLRYSLGLPEAAGAIETAVDNVLEAGFRTPDIAEENAKEVLNTSGMGRKIILRRLASFSQTSTL